jgi:hypothetical protein
MIFASKPVVKILNLFYPPPQKALTVRSGMNARVISPKPIGEGEL